MGLLLEDFRYALRSLRANPGFIVLVLGTFAPAFE